MPGPGIRGHVQADVTLTKYEGNAKPSLDIFAAPDGQPLVAAEFTILSTGDATDDDPGNLGAKVIDSTGNVYAGRPGDPTVGESLDLTLILQPGEKTTGWVIFNVPQDSRITAVTCQIDSLLQTNGEHTARWTSPPEVIAYRAPSASVGVKKVDEPLPSTPRRVMVPLRQS
ncbi:hypothetical protein [Streptomyces sp. NPDC055134]